MCLPTDLSRSVVLYQRAAELGDAHAQYNLGVLYQDGMGVAKDAARSFSLFEAAARQNNADGLRAEGMAYRLGAGVTKDDRKSFELLMRAALLENPRAEFAVSKAYARGWGVSQDDGKADAWRRKAAGHGEGFALLQLALEEVGKVTPASDFAHIATLLRSSLAQEDSILQQSRPDSSRKSSVLGLAALRFFLGGQALAGLGVTEDKAMGRTLVTRAVHDISDYAPSTLVAAIRAAPAPDQAITVFAASLAGDQGSVVTREAFPYFFVAAQAGNPDAQFVLSRAYRLGQVVDRNEAEANAWLRKAAGAGEIRACDELSYDLRNGAEGQTPDISSAAYFTTIAANAGDPWAEAVLGEFYRLGLNGPSDPVNFRLWSLKAAEHGMYRAQADVGYAMLVGYGGPADRVEAMKWMLVAERRAPQNDSVWKARNSANIARARFQMDASEISQAEQKSEAEVEREAEVQRVSQQGQK